jgi:ATP-dependent DNA helicase RecG
MLDIARAMVSAILEKDPDLVSADNLQLKKFLQSQRGDIVWSKIS